ncbi:MAG: Tripartite tricarboxylate transporter TctB family [Rhodobacteraceae bacterium HLUCCA12]|nr:MAG: Tripartite tricarboxylate transporter TctB family [Rhodobacteraceae bacterium HLUCCA12]
MDSPRTAPHIDLLAGGFFLIWASVGWLSYAGNARLRDSLWAGVDPGPALVPVIVLSLLSIGGAFLIAKGALRRMQGQTGGAGLPQTQTHVLPLGFAVVLLGLIVAMPLLGFVPVAIAFCLFWLWMLSPGGAALTGWGLRLLSAVLIGGGIYAIFAGFLQVPLPG